MTARLCRNFPWWVNPAVTVNGHTRTVMPIDVTSVLGYGKRDVSRYPIVTGTYYWHDYSQGADISRYKDAPMPTLYMAAHSSNYDFVGAYDFSRQAGNQRVADHRISPGENLALDGFDSVSSYERVLAGCDS